MRRMQFRLRIMLLLVALVAVGLTLTRSGRNAISDALNAENMPNSERASERCTEVDFRGASGQLPQTTESSWTEPSMA